MSHMDELLSRALPPHIVQALRAKPRRWLITGAAGFIGSNLVEALLKLDQTVVGLDNFATGHKRNIEDVVQKSGDGAKNFKFVEGDICDTTACASACANVDIVLHQAALGSVPRSLANPAATNEANVTGFLNMVIAARDAKAFRFVYAASSSTYGDHPDLPKVEDKIGNPLSPYAVTKYVNELYAGVYASVYNMQLIGLRYFNIFGPRQSPNGAYAAVIPLFIDAIMKNKSPIINGDGEHSRDFTYVSNAVQANVLALFTQNNEAVNHVYNIACGEQTSLVQLFNYLNKIAGTDIKPTFGPPRVGDVKHSLADISK